MTLVDHRGRLFGAVNVLDACVALVAVGVAVGATVAFRAVQFA